MGCAAAHPASVRLACARSHTPLLLLQVALEGGRRRRSAGERRPKPAELAGIDPAAGEPNAPAPPEPKKDDDDRLSDDGIGSDDNPFDDELVDETCPSLAAAGKMSSAGDGLSCSPASCNIVDNPDCDDVTFTQPMNDMESCTDEPESLIYDLFEAEVNDNARSDCSAVVEEHPLCANLPSFLAPLSHAFVGAYCNDVSIYTIF